MTKREYDRARQAFAKGKYSADYDWSELAKFNNLARFRRCWVWAKNRADAPELAEKCGFDLRNYLKFKDLALVGPKGTLP